MSHKTNLYSSKSPETFNIEGKSSVFVHIYSATEAFGFEISEISEFSNIQSHVLGSFKDITKTKAKVIGNYLLARQIQQRLGLSGITIEKAIYAKAYTILYRPYENSIKLLKTPYDKVKVLIVDDSKTIRELIKRGLATNEKVEVVGEAENGQNIKELIQKTGAHVITLDMQMPVVNGVQALKQYFPQFPVPTIVVSAVSLEEGTLAMDAMEAGAFDYIQKPLYENFEQFRLDLEEKIFIAFESKHIDHKTIENPLGLSIKIESTMIDTDKLVVIGASTGGTEAIREVLTRLPKNIPPILIVQHIPAGFSKAFAERMNMLCPFAVKEAQDHDEIMPGHVYIAPGGTQMSVVRSNEKYIINIKDDAPVNRHKPSVDYMFFSVAKNCKKKVVSIMLTGMGADGAKGMLELKKQGAVTIAQNEESSVVFGMPQAAIKLGCVDQVLHLRDIAGELLKRLSSRSKLDLTAKKAV